jgi:hypothetical protein
MSQWRLLMIALVAQSAALAQAHGPQLQITGESGKITTRALLPDSPYGAITAEKSVYVIPLKQNLGAWYVRPNGATNPATQLPQFYSGPGIAYGSAYDPANPAAVDFEVGSQIRLAFLDGLKLWNGSGFQDAGPTELEAFRGSFALPTATARTSDSGPFASIAYDPVNYALEGTDVHTTTRFRLLGDGASPAAGSSDGVYLARMQLTSTQLDMDPSEPFYFVMHKNAPRGVINAAVASLGVAPSLVQIVPEPAAAALAVWVVSGLLIARRRSA